MSRLRWFVLGLTAWLPACTVVGPEYVRPSVPVPEAYRAAGDYWKPAQAGEVLPRGRWWVLFGDSQLDALASRIDAGNPSIQQAEARYRQAQAALRQIAADRYPFATASGAATRSWVEHSGGAVGRYQLGADVSWEPDLWGRLRRSIEVGQAQQQASAADVEAVRLAVTAALIQSYYALRVTDAQTQLLESTVAGYARLLQLTTNRYKAGVVGKSDVVQAQTQLQSAQAQVVDLRLQRTQLEHAIAVLLGEMPATFSLAPAALVVRLPAVPLDVPSSLLQRRPDIAAAERRVASANARIGVAQGAMFPSVTLSGGVGLRSAILPDLLRAPTLFWALGASAAQILFDAGAREAITDQTRAAYDADVAAYRQTVLASFQEVEDSLAAVRLLAEEARLQAAAVASAREALQLIENRYKAGTASFLDVINVQTIALANERTAVAIQGRQLAATVQLIKALGGGWESSALAPSAAESTGR